MKFREEVLAKIFTYITVLLLLTAIIFEAWTVRQERKSRAEAENEIVKLEGYIDGISEEKEQLKAENRELQAFQNIWSNYAAFMASHEVMSLKTDLFTRPDLIPKEAIEAYAAFQYDTQNESEENPDGEAEASGKKGSEKEAEAKRKKRLRRFCRNLPSTIPMGKMSFCR